MHITESDMFYMDEGDYIQLMIQSKETGGTWSYFHSVENRDIALRQYCKLLREEDLKVMWIESKLINPTDKQLKEVELPKIFKVDKEEIVGHLNKVKGVKVVNFNLSEKSLPGFEGAIHVLFELQEGDGIAAIGKSFELQSKIIRLLIDPNHEIHVGLTASDEQNSCMEMIINLGIK